MEMLVALAIVALFAAIATPSFLSSVIRQQIKASIPLADIAKKPIETSWTTKHILLPDNTATGLPSADRVVSNYVKSVEVINGSIHITFGNRANARIAGKILSIRSAVITDAPVVPVAWVCGKAGVPVNMTVSGVDRTDIPIGFLPYECR